jgi:hypothetical protein
VLTNLFLEARGHENSTSVAGTEEEILKPAQGIIFEPPFWDLRRRKRKRFIATQPPSKYVDSIQAFDVSKIIFLSNSDTITAVRGMVILYLPLNTQIPIG